MTVDGTDMYGKWICTWFDNGTVKNHSFGEGQLTDTNPNPDYSGLPISGGGPHTRPL